MVYIRLKSFIQYLKAFGDYISHQIAEINVFPYEKALNNLTDYHTGYPPTEFKSMPEDKLYALAEKLGSKIHG